MVSASVEGRPVRWYGLSEAGKRAATCLWAVDRLRACGLAVPSRLTARLADAVARWRDEAADAVPGPLLQARAVPSRRRRLTRPEEVVRWAMASGACDEGSWGPGAGLTVDTLILPDGVDAGMVSGGRHPVWYGGTVSGHRTWDELSTAGFEAIVALLASQHLRARGFAVPDDLEAHACGSLDCWLREVHREQRARIA